MLRDWLIYVHTLSISSVFYLHQAGKLAMERGWAINVGGGFHHCSRDRGGGFCAYADITLVIKVSLNIQHDQAKKKRSCVALKSENWVGRVIFFHFHKTCGK